MILIIFYSLAIVFGYILMYLYRKYFENRQVYYISWFIFYIILNSIAPLMNESVFYIFESESYQNIDPIITTLFFFFMIIPTMFLVYPILKIGKWIYGSLEEFIDSLMLLFVPKSRKITYFEAINGDIQSQTSENEEQQ